MKQKVKKFSNPITLKLYQQSFKPKQKKKLTSEVIPKSIDRVLENFEHEVNENLEKLLTNVNLNTPIPPRVRIDYDKNELIINYNHRIPIENIQSLNYYEKYIFIKWKRPGLYEHNYEFWRQFFLTCEMSQAVFHIVDCRSVLVEPYVFDLYPSKDHFLILNKIDLLDEKNVPEKIKECQKIFPFFKKILIFSSKDKKYLKAVLDIIFKFKIVGIIGYPNVGKSSFINSIFGKKCVGVSQTPGKTKNLQTLKYGEITIVDCPGLVFSRYSKDILLKNGILNVDQLQFDHDGDVVNLKIELKRKFLGLNG
ncbi:Large subunit GTPase 1 [Dictyocoela muelleri]|nr:Large subunit GTPase 1 [Dictyocoela muelleri]